LQSNTYTPACLGLQSVYFGFAGMQENRPTLDGLEQVLERIASDPRMPANFPDWIRGSLRSGVGKIRVLRYILEHAASGATSPRILDVGAQFGSLAVYSVKLGCHAAAVDYGPAAKIFARVATDLGVDYKECDLGAAPLPFSDNQFDFVTYTDVMEHHSFSPKRVLQEIYRVLVPGGRVIVVTPNHASVYNRLKLLFGGSVNDDFDYFFDLCANERIYEGHHREYTRAEMKTALCRTKFQVRECRVIEQDLTSLVHYLRRQRSRAEILPESRDLLLSALGVIWTVLHLPLGRWIWAIGEKTTGDEN
jgi:SAM-dependent methyltransferase